MRTNGLFARPRVLTLIIVSALGTGMTPNRSAWADLSPTTPTPSTLAGFAATNVGTSTGIWRIPHESTRRDKRPRSDDDSSSSFSAVSSRPLALMGSPTNLYIQDQSLDYQNLYSDDDFQNLGGAGWVQTDQPPLADGEDFPQLRLTTTPVPLPGAVWLGAIGLGSIAWIRRRKGS